MREQILAAITTKLLPKYGARFRNDVAWGIAQARDALQMATADQRQEMLRALAQTTAIRNYLRHLAEQEAESLLANDSLDLDELKRIGL